MLKHLDIEVSGKVQGVFFRATVQQIADEFNIKGFVKNKKDGNVYIEAEGNDVNLSKLIDWCHQGTKDAKVEKVVIQESALKFFKEFMILR